MKKWKIVFREKYIPGPMSFWVHKNPDSEIWDYSTEFSPELPKPVPLKGYPELEIYFSKIKLRFTSINEAEHFLEVITQKNMPTSSQLSRQRGEGYGPNSHWLSRLPSKIKPWAKRKKIIPVLKEGIYEFKKISL